jgi:hypothetical protein
MGSRTHKNKTSHDRSELGNGYGSGTDEWGAIDLSAESIPQAKTVATTAIHGFYVEVDFGGTMALGEDTNSTATEQSNVEEMYFRHAQGRRLTAM